MPLPHWRQSWLTVLNPATEKEHVREWASVRNRLHSVSCFLEDFLLNLNLVHSLVCGSEFCLLNYYIYKTYMLTKYYFKNFVFSEISQTTTTNGLWNIFPFTPCHPVLMYPISFQNVLKDLYVTFMSNSVTCWLRTCSTGIRLRNAATVRMFTWQNWSNQKKGMQYGTT